MYICICLVIFIINMPRQCCFLCASDEGVFLDITADNKQKYHEKFEICSLVKVPTADQLPTKLCHKCAYELNQCSSFVQKFKRNVKNKSHCRKHSCSLCNQPAKNEFMFDLSEDQSTQHSSFDRIEKVFNYDLKDFKENHKYICLSCRYTLDLLFDLKNLSNETATKLNNVTEDRIDYANFPKIQTVVVNRKTTITESARTNLPTLETSNNNSVMTRTRVRNNISDNHNSDKKIQPRMCKKCQTTIRTVDNLFKVPNTKNVVCKKCWLKTDHVKDEVENQGQQNIAETKVCKVFLKDVLKDQELKDQKEQPTNKSVENEAKLNNKVNDTKNGVTRQSQKRSVTETKDESKSTATKKSKVAEQQVNDEAKEQEPTAYETKFRKAKARAQLANQSADSDSSTLKRKHEGHLTAQKRATGASLSDADVESKRNRKKLRNILEGITVIKDLDSTDESSSNENVTPRRKRTRFANVSSVPIPKKGKAVSKTTPSSLSRTVSFRQSKAMIQPKEEPQSYESDNEEVIFDTTTYICDECGASYENKLMGLTHKLTHYKHPKVELQKLKVKDVRKETPDRTEVTDEQGKDQTEITIVVDDDEEEVAKDTSTTESNAEDKKKETMEDAVDMELVMKESDDDCSQATEEKAEDSEKKEAETDSSALDKTESRKNDSNSDNNNRSDKNESPEKQSINTEEEENVSLSNVADAQEEKELSTEDTQEKEESSKAEDTQEKEESSSKVEETQEKRQEDEKKQNEEEESGRKVNDTNENEDTEGKVARTKRKDSSEEEVISLGIWEVESDATEGPQTNSTSKVNDDKADEQEQSVAEKEVKVEIDEQSNHNCIEKAESDNKEPSKTSGKPVMAEDTTLLDENVMIDENNKQKENVSISKSNLSKAEDQNDCVDTAAEVLQEVIDLASAEVQKRHKRNELDDERETVENISREIQNSIEASSVE